MRIVIAALLMVLGCLDPIVASQKSGSSKERETKLLAVGIAAPDWQLSDPEGKVHSLSEYRGKVVVLDFWATWCGPCEEMMPRMQRLHEKYKDKGLEVFGVNSWEKMDPLAVMKKKHYTYGLLLKGENIADLYGVKLLPAVYIIGTDGRIVYRHEGLAKDFGKIIEAQLHN